MTYTTEHFKNELKVLACAFSDNKFHARAKLLPEEFKNTRYRKLYEELLVLKKEGFQGNDSKEWIAEANRRTQEPVEDLLQEFGLGGTYSLEQMRLLNKQNLIKELAAKCDTLAPSELMEELRTLSADHVSQKSQKEVNVTEYVKTDYRGYLKNKREKQEGIYSGRKMFDAVTGLERGQLCTLAARPSVGKSALALNLAYEWAQYGFSVYYASLEMGVEELTHRLMARITGLNATKFKYGNVEPANLIIADRELGGMSGKIEIGYLPGTTIEEILQAASSKSPDVLIVDHIDLVKTQGKVDNEAYAIAQMTSSLKAFAGQKNCLVFCLSQFNRESKGDMPELHQLRGSGAKEQDSDVVLILHRDLDPDAADKTAKLRVAKNRAGQVGDLLLDFKPEITMFYERKN
jgi:replicative DNA helicase